jgi:hypothetical protein
MRIVGEVKADSERVLKNTLIEGRDGKFYMLTAIKLYDFEVKDVAQFEITITLTDASGRRKKLVQPFIKRYYTQQETLKDYNYILENFDQILDLPEARK